MEISKERSPKILVISNNAFSTNSNNGKTLASFFKGFPSDKVAQLFFNSELPSDEYYNNYFRITDLEIIKSMFSREKPGKVLEASKSAVYTSSLKNKSRIINKIKKYNIFRIGREIFWAKNNWNNDLLNQWLKSFSPDIVFLCAGDSVFAYKIANYIHKIYRTKLIIYITDDYILPRKTISPFWWIRRNYIFNEMKQTIQKSDLFITISEEMRITYKKLFGKDSIIAMNITESMKLKKEGLNNNRKVYTLVYTGGLHFNRYKTLNLLANAIKKYNSSSDNKKLFLKVYSGSNPDRKITKYLNIEGASRFCGSLNKEELKRVLNECDTPVHVESFDSKSIESTRLSISTKIPEYLSLEKPILAIGPKEVASMRYLEDCALCISNPDSIYLGLTQLINNSKLQYELSKKAFIKFQENHKKEKVLEELYKKIVN